MFAPAIGIAEDPVTGNANGPLGAYLVKHGLVNHNHVLFCFKGTRRSNWAQRNCRCKCKIENDELVQVKIGGKAVIVFKTQIEL